MEQGQRELHVPYLPLEIMLKIGYQISTWLDVQRFRAAIKVIKENLPSPPHQRLAMTIPSFWKSAKTSEFTKYDVFNCLNGGWVVQVDYNVQNDNGKSPGFMHPLRHDDFHSDELHDHPKKFNLVHSNTIELPGCYQLGRSKVAFRSQSIWKVLEDFQILDIVPWGLALFKSTENACSLFHIHTADVICYKGEFYAVQDNGRTIMVHSADLTVTTKEVAGPIGGETGDRKYLIESGGDLLLVDRYYYVDPEQEKEEEEMLRTSKFTVFKLDEAGNRWVRVFTLGDHVILVGYQHHFSVAASNVAGARTDLIYFSEAFSLDDQEEETDEHTAGAYDVAFFDMTTNNITQLIYAREFAACFWPPPPWTRDEVV